MPQAFGLSTWQWSNNLKSLFLLAAFPFLLLALMAGIFYVSGWVLAGPSGAIDPRVFWQLGLHPPTYSLPLTPPLLMQMAVIAYWPIILGIAIVWVLIGTFFNDAMIHAMTGAAPVTRTEAPELYNTLENLCISRGIKMPNLYLIDSDALNAYASGIDEKSFSITVTRGLLQVLTREEVEAVLGHELTHIRNRDVRLLIVTIVFAGMISFIAQMLWRSLRFASFSRDDDNRGRGGGAILVLMMVAAVMLGIGYLFALILRFALSRKREYLADAGSVELTKNPEALISALRKISTNPAVPHVPTEAQQMFIENPPSVFSLFDTHPPIESRIAVLQMIGGLPPEGKSMIPNTGG